MRRPPGGANLGAPNSDPYQLIAGAFGPRRAPKREQGGRKRPARAPDRLSRRR